LKLRKPKLHELWNDHKKLREEAETLLQAFKKLPVDQVGARLALAKEMVAKFVEASEIMLDFLERFTPTATKELRFKLDNHKRMWDDWLTKLPDPRIPNREVIINDRMTIMLDSIDFFQQLEGIVLLTAMETLKRTKGVPPEQLDEYLENRLRKLGNDYAALYEGAWNALESEENPDRFRQCAASARELVTHMIGAKGPQRRTELRRLLKEDRQVRLAESIAEAVDQLYETLSKGVHAQIDFETALLCVKLTEHLTRYLLECGYPAAKVRG